MYRILIVDDDNSIRTSLVSMLKKDEDIEIAGFLKDGEEAVRFIHEMNPQIIIFEPTSNYRDGIEFIKKVKSMNENIQIIVLSKYADFNCVRLSMKAGAFDYLLKENLKEKELKYVIDQLKDRCKVDDEIIVQKQADSLDKLKQLLILRKNDHQVGGSTFLQVLQKANLEVLLDSYQIAYFRIDNIHLIYKTKIHNHAKLHEDLNKLFKKTLSNSFKYEVLFISNHSGIIIFNGKNKLRSVNICNIIMKNVAQKLDLDMSITISKVLHNDIDFLLQYEMLLELHEMRFYIGERVLIETEELMKFNILRYDDINFHMDIINSIEQRSFHDLSKLKPIALTYMKEHFIKPMNVLDLFYFIFNVIEGKEMEKGIKVSALMEEEKQKIYMCETMDMLDEILDEIFTSFEQWLCDSSTNRYRQDVIDIIDYIDNNIASKINLKMICDNFNMNESYLSRLFKNQTGKNLIYFINEKKMQKAKQFLQNPNLSIKEVSTMVGIEDQFYFNKVFKKFYDTSPSEYRKNMY